MSEDQSTPEILSNWGHLPAGFTKREKPDEVQIMSQWGHIPIPAEPDKKSADETPKRKIIDDGAKPRPKSNGTGKIPASKVLRIYSRKDKGESAQVVGANESVHASTVYNIWAHRVRPELLREYDEGLA